MTINFISSSFQSLRAKLTGYMYLLEGGNRVAKRRDLRFEGGDALAGGRHIAEEA